jgi:hypothetical protein
MSWVVNRSVGSRVRVVDSIWIACTPLAFRELCERAIPPEARLVVLSLDRTLHLGRNMGELFHDMSTSVRGGRQPRTSHFPRLRGT